MVNSTKSALRTILGSLVGAVLLVSCNSFSAANPTSTITQNLTPEFSASTKIAFTITPMFLHQAEPNCPRSKFDVVVMGSPAFCVVWVDKFQNEAGFHVTLTYINSGEVFVYQVGTDVTQLLIPDEHVPVSSEVSQEDCIKRQIFKINVTALLSSGNIEVGETAGQGECYISTPQP